MITWGIEKALDTERTFEELRVEVRWPGGYGSWRWGWRISGAFSASE
jgi:hypothetical protein